MTLSDNGSAKVTIVERGSDENTLGREFAQHQLTVQKVKEFLERVLSTPEKSAELGRWKVPTLVDSVKMDRTSRMVDEVYVDPDSNSITVNEGLLNQDPEKLRVNIASATGSYYLEKTLAAEGNPMSQMLQDIARLRVDGEVSKDVENRIVRGIETENLSETLIASQFAISRLTAIAYRRQAVMGGYGDPLDFVHELYWYKSVGDRQLARHLHNTFGDIQSGEFRFGVLDLVFPKYKAPEIIELGRRVAILEYIKHGGDAEASIRGLFRPGPKAILGLKKTDMVQMHRDIDRLLKKQEEGWVENIEVEKGGKVTLTISIKLKQGEEPVELKVTDQDIEGYMAKKKKRTEVKESKRKETLDRAAQDASRRIHESDPGMDVVRSHYQEEYTAIPLPSVTVEFIPGVHGPEDDMDALAQDCAELIAAIQRKHDPDDTREIKRATVAFRVYGLDSALPVDGLVDLTGGHSLRTYARMLIESNLMEEFPGLDQHLDHKVTYYRLTAKGRERVERILSTEKAAGALDAST